MGTPNVEALSRQPDNRAIKTKEWTEFKSYVTGFSEQEQADIEHAYHVSETAHQEQYRKSGERYFSHPRECALILLKAGVTTRVPIILALLHDVSEDTDHLEKAPGPTPVQGYGGFDRIVGSFGRDIACKLTTLTKLDNSLLTKEENDEEYHEQWKEADSDEILVKMADRLHNLRTLAAMPYDKQKAKIEETREFYLPLFERVLIDYPTAGAKLLQQIQAALQAAEIGVITQTY